MVLKVHWSFLKKGWRLISSTPFLPNRTSLKTKRANEWQSNEHPLASAVSAAIGKQTTPTDTYFSREAIKKRVDHTYFSFTTNRSVFCGAQWPQRVTITLPTCQSGRHRWYSWHLWRSPHHLGSWGSFYGPWSYCRFPPESRRRTVCRLPAITVS